MQFAGTSLETLLGLAVILFTLVVLVSLLRSSQASRRRMASIHNAQEATLLMCGEGLLIVDSRGQVLEANGLAQKILSADLSKSGAAKLPEPIHALLSDPDAQRHRLRLGKDQLIDLALSAKDTTNNNIRGILVRDVTEQQRGQRQLMRLANYDSLTGLGNRRLFLEYLMSAIERSRSEGSHLALFYIDIDRFKEVNDTFGHGVGDELLKSISVRLCHEMKEWEASQEDRRGLVARLSGDEFAVIAVGASTPIEIDHLADAILRRISDSLKTDDAILNPSGSVGISMFPDDGDDVEDLVKAADAALYVAKEQGRGRHVRYEESFAAIAEQTRRVEDQLKMALQRQEFRLHYQPKVELENFTTAGFEALLRWQNDELGFVSPKDFIPIAEERGLISDIGAWCIDETCRQIRVWRDAGYETVPVSVNVSSVQFAESDLQRVVTDALVRHNIEPSALELELTESLILDDNDSTALTLRDLRAIGVRVALDDFGTGYSALTYLTRFPLDTIKMDRGFLRGIENDDAAAGIVAAVITMSHSLGFDVVAEGVDSERQSRLLQNMKCEQIQGFLYSPPVAAAEAARFLAAVGSHRPKMDSDVEGSEIDEILASGDSTSFGKNPLIETFDAPPKAHLPKTKARRSRVLVIDDQGGTIGPVALRMVQLGADTHMVQSLDEATLFVRQEELSIDLLVVEPSVDLSQLAMLRETVTKVSGDRAPRVLVIGDEINEERRELLRESSIDWMLLGHAEDHLLRFFVGAAGFRGTSKLMQRSVRVPVDTTVWIRSGGSRRVGTLTSLSRRGAAIETDDIYEAGQSLQLEFKIEERRIRVFGTATYCHEAVEDDDAYRPPQIGVMFLEPEADTEEQISAIVEDVWNQHRP